LEECKAPIRKTPLMARASASKVTLDKILRLCLLEPSLLVRRVTQQGVVYYQITELGVTYLETYNNLMKIVKPRKIAQVPTIMVRA
jgi:predicted transcriptional regulator